MASGLSFKADIIPTANAANQTQVTPSKSKMAAQSAYNQASTEAVAASAATNAALDSWFDANQSQNAAQNAMHTPDVALSDALSKYSQAGTASTSAQNNVQEINNQISSAKKNNADYKQANELASKDLANESSANTLLSSTHAKAQAANDAMQDLDRKIVAKTYIDRKHINPKFEAIYKKVMENIQRLQECTSNKEHKQYQAGIEKQISKNKQDSDYRSMYDDVTNLLNDEPQAEAAQNKYYQASTNYDNITQKESDHAKTNAQYESAYDDLQDLYSANQALTTAKAANDTARQLLMVASKAHNEDQQN